MNRYTFLVLGLLCSAMITAQVYDIVVAKDGTGSYTTISEAITAAPTGTARTAIFVKKGVYNEKVYLGSHSTAINKVISLIGENPDSVIITWDDYNGKLINYYGSSSQTPSGTHQSATFTVNAADFYMENITIRNTYTTKQAVALYNVGDRQTFKNCRLVGFQDTHYLKKGRRSFFYNTRIEGGTDFICAGGTAYFYRCTLKSLAGGQYITAPEDVPYTATLPAGKTLYYGFIFKDCDLIADPTMSPNAVYLGRPWQGTSGSIFMNCRLGTHLSSAGWSVWSGNSNHLTSFFAEYKSMNADGSALADVSQRVTWSFQLSAADVNNYLLISKIYTTGSFSSSTSFDPVSLVIAPTPVASVSKDGQILSWTAIEGAKGYVIYADGSAIGFSTSSSYIDGTTRITTPVYFVRTVGTHGNLSLPDGSTDTVTAASINSAINTVQTGLETKKHSNKSLMVESGNLVFSEITNFSIYNVAGQLVLSGKQVTSFPLTLLSHGIYIVKACDGLNGTYQTKIRL